MATYKITLAYDGTNFHGWQIQPDKISIASCVQDAWRRIFNQEITLVGASRTDAGVHALGQVARFKIDLPAQLTMEEVRSIWNNHLPKSIVIRQLAIAPDTFHPCANVKQKTYYYTLFLQRPLPFVARFGWYYCFIDRVDLNKFYQALQLYKGTHDFGSFCKIETDDVTTVRTIDDITVKKIAHWNALLISIKGPGFARFQIRRMIGYALDVARRKELGLNYLQDILKNPNPQQTLLKADGSGLCLRKVVYNDDQR